jgi:hypothetical protein
VSTFTHPIYEADCYRGAQTTGEKLGGVEQFHPLNQGFTMLHKKIKK